MRSVSGWGLADTGVTRRGQVVISPRPPEISFLLTYAPGRPSARALSCRHRLLLVPGGASGRVVRVGLGGAVHERPARTLVLLSPAPEHRRGHGAISPLNAIARPVAGVLARARRRVRVHDLQRVAIEGLQLPVARSASATRAAISGTVTSRAPRHPSLEAAAVAPRLRSGARRRLRCRRGNGWRGSRRGGRPPSRSAA